MILKFVHHFRNNRFYSKLIRKGDLCFDIGANLGAKSKLFLSLGASVIAFEPQKACHPSLQELSAKNPNFKFYPFAAGEKNEEKVLHLANHIEVATLSSAFINYFQCEEIHWDKSEIVTVKTLDSLIETYGFPYFCKLDVEGFEWEVLSQLSHNIPIIEFEFTGGFIENTVKIIKNLDRKNAKFNYVMNENLKFKLKAWVSGEEMINIILSLPKNRLHGNIYVKNKSN